MKFKSKLFLTNISIFVLLIVSLLFAYANVSRTSHVQVEKSVQREIELKQTSIESSMKMAINNLTDKKEFIRRLHAEAIEHYHQKSQQIISDDNNQKAVNKQPKQLNINKKRLNLFDLAEIKQQILRKYNLSSQEVDLFLIDNNKRIFASTRVSDIGFDLSGLPESSETIDKAFLHKGIHTDKHIWQDHVDLRYKVYSYSQVSDDAVLKMSFTDNSSTEVFLITDATANDSLTTTIYSIYQIEDKFFYLQKGQKPQTLPIREDKTQPLKTTQSKKKVQQPAQKLTKNDVHDDIVLQAFFEDKEIVIEKPEQQLYTVYVPLHTHFDGKQIHENLVIKYEMDLTEKNIAINAIKNSFVKTALVAIFALLLIDLVIRKQLATPVDLITEHIKQGKQIPTVKFDNKNDEFFEIANEYNNVYRKLSEELEKNKLLTRIDPLTQVGNRHAFDQQLNGLIANTSNTHFCIMIYDIDNFKRINDELGHFTGDQVLKESAELLKNLIRDQDRLYRIGGEEFVVLFADTDLVEALEIGEHLRLAFEAYFKDWHGMSITISAGISQVRDDDVYESLYTRVDDLLYQAKDTGKNQICC